MAQLSLHHDSLVQCLHTVTEDAAPIDAVNFTLPLTLTLPRAALSPHREDKPPFLRERTMASHLEVPTLIPTVSHSAANRSSECWKSQSDEAKRTTSSAKSKGYEHNSHFDRIGTEWRTAVALVSHTPIVPQRRPGGTPP